MTTEIGHGAFATVYKFGNKAIKKYLMDDKDEYQSYLREIAAYKKLKGCPNILPIYHHSDTSIVMKYYKYNLSDYLDEHVLDYHNIKTLLFNIFNGVFNIHANDIIHRDINMNNILINDVNDVVIADFNLARYKVAQACIQTFPTQTYWYRAPEVSENIHYDKKIDLYSLGKIMTWIKQSYDLECSIYDDLMTKLLGKIPMNRPNIVTAINHRYFKGYYPEVVINVDYPRCTKFLHLNCEFYLETQILANEYHVRSGYDFAECLKLAAYMTNESDIYPDNNLLTQLGYNLFVDTIYHGKLKQTVSV